MLNNWLLQVGRECLHIYVCTFIIHLLVSLLYIYRYKECGAYSLQIIKILYCEFYIVN